MNVRNTANVFMFLLLCWLLITSTNVAAGGFSLIDGYKLRMGCVEVKIHQLDVPSVVGADNLRIEISKDNELIVRDNTDKALAFSVKSKNDLRVLENLKRNCLDKLSNSTCLIQFVEKFYTLFDPFGLEYEILSDDDLPVMAKLVKMEDTETSESTAMSGYPNPVRDILFLKSTNEIIGPVKVYDIRSGQNVITQSLGYGQNSLDLSGLKKGTYLLIAGSNVLKIFK